MRWNLIGILGGGGGKKDKAANVRVYTIQKGMLEYNPIHIRVCICYIYMYICIYTWENSRARKTLYRRTEIKYASVDKSWRVAFSSHLAPSFKHPPTTISFMHIDIYMYIYICAHAYQRCMMSYCVLFSRDWKFSIEIYIVHIWQYVYINVKQMFNSLLGN